MNRKWVFVMSMVVLAFTGILLTAYLNINSPEDALSADPRSSYTSPIMEAENYAGITIDDSSTNKISIKVINPLEENNEQ